MFIGYMFFPVKLSIEYAEILGVFGEFEFHLDKQ